ncbi:MAG: hypothetical protein IJP17_04015, partial [Clostridia bacterium]|nr:hypothetical protein [Clostridia bacterium]
FSSRRSLLSLSRQINLTHSTTIFSGAAPKHAVRRISHREAIYHIAIAIYHIRRIYHCERQRATPPRHTP